MTEKCRYCGGEINIYDKDRADRKRAEELKRATEPQRDYGGTRTPIPPRNPNRRRHGKGKNS